MGKLIFAAFLTLLMVLSVSALNVADEAGLLDESHEQALEEKIKEIRDTYQYDIVLLTVETLDGQDIFTFADDYFDYNGYGAGENYDGMIFVISMQEREFATSTCGNGIFIFSDYTLDNIHQNIVTYLSDEDYDKAFEEYLAQIEYVLYSAANSDTAVDIPYNSTDSTEDYYPEYDDSLYTYSDESDVGFYVIFEICVIVTALVIGLIVVSIMKAPMKNIAIKKDADVYTGDDDLMITRQVDRFMYSSITKTRINNNNSRSAGGSFGGGISSTRIGASGRSHGGRSGKF